MEYKGHGVGETGVERRGGFASLSLVGWTPVDPDAFSTGLYRWIDCKMQDRKWQDRKNKDSKRERVETKGPQALISL